MSKQSGSELFARSEGYSSHSRGTAASSNSSSLSAMQTQSNGSFQSSAHLLVSSDMNYPLHSKPFAASKTDVRAHKQKAGLEAVSGSKGQHLVQTASNYGTVFATDSALDALAEMTTPPPHHLQQNSAILDSVTRISGPGPWVMQKRPRGMTYDRIVTSDEDVFQSEIDRVQAQAPQLSEAQKFDEKPESQYRQNRHTEMQSPREEDFDNLHRQAKRLNAYSQGVVSKKIRLPTPSSPNDCLVEQSKRLQSESSGKEMSPPASPPSRMISGNVNSPSPPPLSTTIEPQFTEEQPATNTTTITTVIKTKNQPQSSASTPMASSSSIFSTTSFASSPSESPKSSKSLPIVCSQCGKSQPSNQCPFTACGRCFSHYYCSQECQFKHWKVHASKCQSPAFGSFSNIEISSVTSSYSSVTSPSASASRSTSISNVLADLLASSTSSVLSELRTKEREASSTSFTKQFLTLNLLQGNALTCLMEVDPSKHPGHAVITHDKTEILVDFDPAQPDELSLVMKSSKASSEHGLLIEVTKASKPTKAKLGKLVCLPGLEGSVLLLSSESRAPLNQNSSSLDASVLASSDPKPPPPPPPSSLDASFSLPSTSLPSRSFSQDSDFYSSRSPNLSPTSESSLPDLKLTTPSSAAAATFVKEEGPEEPGKARVVRLPAADATTAALAGMDPEQVQQLDGQQKQALCRLVARLSDCDTGKVLHGHETSLDSSAYTLHGVVQSHELAAVTGALAHFHRVAMSLPQAITWQHEPHKKIQDSADKVLEANGLKHFSQVGAERMEDEGEQGSVSHGLNGSRAMDGSRGVMEGQAESRLDITLVMPSSRSPVRSVSSPAMATSPSHPDSYHPTASSNQVITSGAAYSAKSPRIRRNSKSGSKNLNREKPHPTQLVQLQPHVPKRGKGEQEAIAVALMALKGVNQVAPKKITAVRSNSYPSFSKEAKPKLGRPATHQVSRSPPPSYEPPLASSPVGSTASFASAESPQGTPKLKARKRKLPVKLMANQSSDGKPLLTKTKNLLGGACEWCGSKNPSYGSGRFCRQICARAFSSSFQKSKKKGSA
eukprot:g51250.t1